MQESMTNRDQGVSELLDATTILVHVVAMIIVDLETVPLEDRTRSRLVADLQAYAEAVIESRLAAGLPERVGYRAQLLCARLVEHVEEMSSDPPGTEDTT